MYPDSEWNHYTDGANVNDPNDNPAHSTHDGRHKPAAARPHSIPLTAAPDPAEYACPEPAEWDGDDVLLRKFIHGPCIDEPRSASLRAGSFCMLESPPSGGIEAAGSYAGTYYYHYDALGSVVALSDADGETVQVYEYDVYGQPAAADPGHPNPFAFTGRRFDPETGLYYYRARYYNPTIGRFLQTDPIGYADGLNAYAYCRNNPLSWADPSGLVRVAFYDGADTTQGASVDGDQMREMATDTRWFDYTFDMRNGESL